jgi:hypothetical protein
MDFGYFLARASSYICSEILCQVLLEVCVIVSSLSSAGSGFSSKPSHACVCSVPHKKQRLLFQAADLALLMLMANSLCGTK